MRTIEEVVKEISDNAQYRNCDPTYLFQEYDVEKALNEILEIHKAEQKSWKWIPVSERLPEENETVLINYCRLNERSVRMAIWDELHCRFYNSEYTKYVSVDFVTAWMPLPEPYEPQESDKCSKCKYYINPDYTRCKECGAERSDKE